MSLLDHSRNLIEKITLKDGACVILRPIVPEDAPLLQEGFARLSPQTIYMRFLETFRELTDERAQAFANIDYHNQMAFVGAIQEDNQEHLVVVARYSLIGPERPGMAEAAIVVRDDYQNRGLGSIAMDCLTRYACKNGVQAFVATIHMNNAAITHFIRRSGFSFERRVLEPGIWEMIIWLDKAS